MSRRVLAFVLLVVAAAGAWGQNSGADPIERPVAPDAQPYEPEEFPPWALSLRRAEVVALGALPISLLTSRLLFGLVRFAGQSISTGTIGSPSVPGLSQSSEAVLGRRENLQIIGGALWISVMVAVADYALGEFQGADE
ncbi:MAG: hypothetical protein ACOC6J_09505 [Spirochaetota bacterium]